MSKDKKIRIALIKPPQETNEIQPPLGLGYLASSISHLAEVCLIDAIKNKLRIKDILRIILSGNFDIVGFQCYTVDFNTVKILSHKIKQQLPRTLIILGGPHPTLAPEDTLQNIQADFAFIGDSELSLPIFVRMLKEKKLSPKNLKKIPGIAYKNGKKIVSTKPQFPCELDKFSPSWHLYHLENYPLAPHGAFCRQYPVAPIIVTRGCPFNCTYCGASKISGFKIRSHSVEFVLAQIESLVKNYGIKEVHIEDDNFTMNRAFVEDFCSRLIKKRLGVSWTCPNGVRIDTLDEKLIRLMKLSGLYSLSVGIESGSDRIRKLMRKNLSTAVIREKLNLINDLGIDTVGFFILGYPDETLGDINQTINFACSLPLKRATFSAFKPFPGTDIYKELVSKGEVKEVDYSNFSLDKVAWAPKGISTSKLKNLRRKAFLKFYLRPRILLGLLRDIKNFQHLKFIIIRIYRWLLK